MNRFFEFSQAQIKTLTALLIIIVVLGGYRLIRDYWLAPEPEPRPWKFQSLANFESTLMVNINTSPVDSLELIPGIGPELSRRILQYRRENGQFAAVDSLILVTGIGPVKLNAIRKFVKVN
ncbi:MAG: helix-hairpin-helix domain-containing protein [candidate division Zixibacteria bacterium]|nr:helix-hairpin-helix domain-containing protein [candidate division Zixibacteria bacterium]